MIFITSLLASFFVYQWQKAGFLYAFALAVFMEMIFLMILSFVLQKHENRVKEAKKDLASEKNNRADLERQISTVNQKIESQRKELKQQSIELGEEKAKYSEYAIKEKRFKDAIKKMKDEIESMNREIATYKHRLGIDE